MLLLLALLRRWPSAAWLIRLRRGVLNLRRIFGFSPMVSQGWRGAVRDRGSLAHIELERTIIDAWERPYTTARGTAHRVQPDGQKR